MSTRTRAYLDFMDWLAEYHPEIQKKYRNNFNVPQKPGEGISVNSSFRITPEEYEMLDEITRSYYSNE